MTTDTADKLVGWVIALTVMVSVALVLAAFAWWRVGRYMRECRSTVSSYQGVAKRLLEDTQPHPVVDDDPVPTREPVRRSMFDRAPVPRDGSTEVLPSVGTLTASSETGWWHQTSAPGRHRLREEARHGDTILATSNDVTYMRRGEVPR